jgi:alkylhydroperoxidase family enzyme
LAWVRTVPPEEATGLLKSLYDAAINSAGRVFNVISLQSIRPKVLRASTMLYSEVMFGKENALTRAQREMIATVVSRINECHY